MIELYTIVDGVIKPCIPEIMNIAEFAAVWKKVKTMKGDSDGRKKKLNTLELLYIKMRAEADYESSIYYGLSDEDRHNKIVKNHLLPSSYRPNTDVLKAIKVYKDIQNTYIPTARILNALQRGLMFSADAIDSYTQQIQSLLAANQAQLNNVLAGKMEEGESIQSVLEINSLIQANLTSMLTIGQKLPKTLDEIAKLKNTVKEEKGATRRLSGGRRKFNRE